MFEMVDRFNSWVAEVEVSERTGITGIVFFSVMLGAGVARAWFGI